MSEVIITVRGEHEVRIAPEEGVARITVRAEGPEREQVVERIAALAIPLREDLSARKEQGTIVDWSSQRTTVWANRPWNSDGTQLAFVHYASVEITATFADFAALSWWISEVAERPGVQVDGVTWRLTPATVKKTESEVATAAVRVAVDRATAYAGAIGLWTITPLEIADLGLLTHGTAEGGGPHGPTMIRAMALSAMDGSAPSVQFQPEEIVVTAGVEARFMAR